MTIVQSEKDEEKLSFARLIEEMQQFAGVSPNESLEPLPLRASRVVTVNS